MNEILNREQEEFEKLWFDEHGKPFVFKRNALTFLSASNKRVALAVLGSVMKNWPKEKSVASCDDEGYCSCVPEENIGFNSALSAAKKIIDDEKERWV